MEAPRRDQFGRALVGAAIVGLGVVVATGSVRYGLGAVIASLGAALLIYGTVRIELSLDAVPPPGSRK